MMGTTLHLAETLGIDLSSRHRAAETRDDIVKSIFSQRSPFIIDFDGVRTVSHSFVDELLAVMIVQHGEEWFRQHVQLVNLPSHIRFTILEAIQHRLESPTSPA